MSYNLTGIMGNTTGMLSFVQGINTVLVGGWLGVLLLTGISLIIFLTFMQTLGDTNRAVAGTSFIAFVLSLLLGAMQLMSPTQLYTVLILMAASIAFTWKTRG